MVIARLPADARSLGQAVRRKGFEMNAIVQTERLVSAPAGEEQDFSQGRSLTSGIHLNLCMLLSLMPSVTLILAWIQFHDSASWAGVSNEAAIVMAVSLWFAELTIVPLLVKIAHLFGSAPEPRSAHHDFEFLEAFAPTVLMLTPLSLVVLRLSVYGVAASFVAVAMLLFVVRYENANAEDADFSASSWLVVYQGFIGWGVVTLLLALM